MHLCLVRSPKFCQAWADQQLSASPPPLVGNNKVFFRFQLLYTNYTVLHHAVFCEFFCYLWHAAHLTDLATGVGWRMKIRIWAVPSLLDHELPCRFREPHSVTFRLFGCDECG